MNGLRHQLPRPWNTEKRKREAAEIVARYWDEQLSPADNIETISWWLRQALRNGSQETR